MERPPISFARDARALSLEELVGEARDAYVAELEIPMTVTQPPAPVTRAPDGTWQRGKSEATQIGRPLSSQLVTRIGHPEGFGNTFPVARSLDDLRGWCRGRHLEGARGPWSDHRRDIDAGAELWDRIARYRPTCARLALYTVVWRVPLSRLAQVEQLPRDRVAELLLGALRHAWDQRRDWAHAPESGAGEVVRDLRRERRQARERAAAAQAPGTTCRACGGPYDASSQIPCPAGGDLGGLVGADVLCTPR